MEAKAVFPAMVGNLHEMLQWISLNILDSGIRFSEQAAQKIELASEEAIVNIIRHGYQESAGEIEIAFRSIPPETFEIILKDRGIPHNPLHNRQDLDPSLNRVGGHGVRLILSLMDNVSYERKDGCNILTLICEHPMAST